MSSVSEKSYDVITNRILALLEQGTAPWQQPWSHDQGMPRNLLSQRPYHGINVWLLGSMAYTSPFWCTFNQAKAAGGSVRKGECGSPVVFWKVYEGAENEEGETQKRFVLRYFTVFNAAQIDGIALPPVAPVTHRHSPIERCEKLVDNYPLPPSIQHGGAQAYYRPSVDVVQMPLPETFHSPEAYYSTLFHELTHSTGHKARLDRTTLKDMVRFGDTSYAKEELIAEMGATYLCGMCGISNRTINNSTAYLAGWLKALRNDSKMLVSAAAQAQKAADYIQNVAPGVADED
jgi:antirestriction protein ArdC